ncbi:hypothetical protein [Novipirellula herctigrandis]|uniref:hypothetical protein n=1 Tax=Novipirellula herctigrandis TaxID=2527986 RepID=UPI003AF34247
MRRQIGALIACVLTALVAVPSQGANFRTRNFIIQAPNAQLARQVGEAAERYRNDLAVYWTGQPLPSWPTPCPVRVVAGPQLAAQGVTTYNRSPVRDFQMEVVGTPERILDSVLPHEVTHTILATHFGRPLPRWADEGICTTVEHDSERQKHEHKLREFLRTRRGIPMNKLFLLTEYPNDVLPMYAQGYSVCRFLIDQQGPQTFIAFLHDYMQHPSWTGNVRKHYGYESLAELQDFWLSWVAAGSGPSAQFAKINRDNPNGDIALAAANSTANNQPVALADLQIPANDPPSNSAASTRTSGPAGKALGNSIAPATALASIQPGSQSGGWYMRRKMGTAGLDQPSQAATAVKPSKMASDRLMPPSVRNTFYSAAQPQPEQSMSRKAAVAPAAEGRNANHDTAVSPAMDPAINAATSSIRLDQLQGQADRLGRERSVWR